MKQSPLLGLLLFTAISLTGSAEVKVEKYKAGDWEDDIGYRQAVRAGQFLFISGTTAPGEMTDAIKQVYGDLEKTLNAHGLTFKSVVKENIYTTNLGALRANQEIRKKYYAKISPPPPRCKLPGCSVRTWCSRSNSSPCSQTKNISHLETHEKDTGKTHSSS